MNSFYELHEMAKDSDDWITTTYKTSETGILDDEELNNAKKNMSKDQYNQEYECS